MDSLPIGCVLQQPLEKYIAHTLGLIRSRLLLILLKNSESIVDHHDA